jgi:hypothetical protein
MQLRLAHWPSGWSGCRVALGALAMATVHSVCAIESAQTVGLGGQ